MVKRQKWKKLEDKKLSTLIKNQKGSIKWDVVAHQISNGCIKKSAKQCRERWLHQLDPELQNTKWTFDENKKLFKLHLEIGNKWKNISSHFEGRTDNTIKNNFFSLIRKSLRTACKVLGNIGNTEMINKIKPKVLSEYIVQELIVDFEEFNKTNPDDKEQPENVEIKLMSLYKNFPLINLLLFIQKLMIEISLLFRNVLII